MGFLGFSNIGQSVDNGKVHYQYYTKASLNGIGIAGYWVDLAPSSGQPKYQAYAGTQQAATPLYGSANDGIYQGTRYAGSSKHILRINAVTTATVAPVYLQLCDYVLFYPLVDGDDADLQVLDNTLTLPRYTTGAGLRAIFVAASPLASPVDVTMNYYNQDGVLRSVTFSVIAGSIIGQICNCQGQTATSSKVTPFVPLASGDTGIRSIDSIQMLGGAGGFFNVVLVKPLVEIALLEANVAAERMFGPEFNRMPEILDQAYLNFIGTAAVSAGWNLRAELIFISS